MHGSFIKLLEVEAVEFQGRQDGRTVSQHLMSAHFDDGADNLATGEANLLETP